MTLIKTFVGAPTGVGAGEPLAANPETIKSGPRRLPGAVAPFGSSILGEGVPHAIAEDRALSAEGGAGSVGRLDGVHAAKTMTSGAAFHPTAEPHDIRLMRSDTAAQPISFPSKSVAPT